MRVNDAFEIREDYQTGHDPGLVVVLDTLLTRETDWLVGCMACILTTSGHELTVPIVAAKNHGSVNSLFFRGLTGDDVPIGSEVTIALPPRSGTKETAALLAS